MKYQKNAFLSTIIMLEMLVLITLILLAFRKPGSQEFLPEDLQEAEFHPVEYLESGVGTSGEEETEEKTTTLLLESDRFALGSGAYEVEIQYESAYDPENPQQNASDKIGQVDIITDKNPMALKTFPFFLYDGNSRQTGRIWLRLGAGVKDLQVQISYYGTGKLIIQGIRIQEQMVYRFVRILGFLLLFLAADFIYLVFSRNTILRLSEERKWEILGLGAVIFVSSLPYFADFLYEGHDLEFHIHRIYRLAESIQEQMIPQRIAFGALNGYGYASPLTYGELFLYFPAALYCLWVPMQTCYQIYVIMVNTATCLISFWCFRRLCQDWKVGMFGAAVYTLSAYRMVNLLTRAAVGEYTAMIFLPLVCYGFLHVYQKNENEKISFGECLPIVFGLTGIVESHVLTCEMSAFFLLIFVVIFWKRTCSRYRFWVLLQAATVTVLLNLWFLVPCLSSMAGMDLGAGHVGARIENKGVYLIQLFGIFQTRSGKNVIGGLQNEMPLTLGITLTLGLLLYLACCVKRESWKLKEHAFLKQAGVFFGFTLVALFLSSNYFWSDNLVNQWKFVKTIYGTLQFPWRFLALATVFASFSLVLCLGIVREKKGDLVLAGVMAVLFLPGMLSVGLYMTDFTNSVYEEKYYSFASEDPVSGSNAAWFELTGTDNDLTYVKTPITGSGVQASDAIYKAGTYTITCANTLEESSFLDFPVFHYNNYHVYDQKNGYELPIQTGENNRVQVELPAGYTGTLVLKYETPVYWRVCEMISLFTLVFILFYLWRKNRVEKN